MLKTFFLLLLLVSLKSYGQTETLVKDFCHCDPLTFSALTDAHQIYFIEKVGTDEEDISSFELHLKTIQKQEGSWRLLTDEKIDLSTISLSQEEVENGFEDYFEYIETPEDYHEMKASHLQGQDYLFSVLTLGKSGTAYNGLHEYLFVFKGTESEESPHIYYYQQAEYEKNFRLRNGNRKSDLQDPFYRFTLDYIKKNFQTKKPAYFIPEEDVYHWRAANPHLFSNLSSTETSKISFSTYPSIRFYNQYKANFKDCEIENDHYAAYSGFKSPVFVYDKIKDESLLVFIPEGWPNGGAWGMRSYTVADWKGNQLHLYALGSSKILVIDLQQKTIQYKEKES